MDELLTNVVLISTAITALGTIYGFFAKSTNTKIADLTKEMDGLKQSVKEHNEYAKKFAELSGDIKVINKSIEFQSKQIDEFKKEVMELLNEKGKTKS